MSQTIKLPTTPVRVIFVARTSAGSWIYDLSQKNPWYSHHGPRPYRDSEINGDEYLTEFLAIRTPERAATFLDRYGNPGLTLPTDNRLDRVVLRFADLRDFRRVLVEAAARPIAGWEDLKKRQGFWSMLNRWPIFQFELANGRLEAVLRTDEGWHACIAQLFIQKATGTEYRACGRYDCDRWYRTETRHKRFYCSPDCAHLCAVRASRDRKQKTVQLSMAKSSGPERFSRRSVKA